MPPERALRRLQQLAREQDAAVAAGDVAALCHISSLLGPAVDALRASDPTSTPELRAKLDELRRAFSRSEAFLQTRMGEVAALLAVRARARRASSAYGSQAARARRLDKSG